MIVPITKLANFLAKYSCPKWNSGNPANKLSVLIHKVLRRLCRYLFWWLATVDYWLFAPSSVLRVPRCVCRTKFGNTYPKIFQLICDWEEDDDALVVDPANFVIKYATSYCAWKIYELTGKWPTKQPKIVDAKEYAQRERKHDAKYWLEFIQAQDCCLSVVAADELYIGHHYIGIDPDYGKYGLVVWFEELIYNVYSDDITSAWVTTYKDKQYVREGVLLADFIWVEVGKKSCHK